MEIPDDIMSLMTNPATVPIISASIGGGLVFLGTWLKDYLSARRQDGKRQIEQMLKRERREREVCYSFLEAFSNPMVDDDISKYLKVSVELARFIRINLTYGPFKPDSQLIKFEIRSLDSLIAAMIIMKAFRPDKNNAESIAQYRNEFEDLRKKSLTAFLDILMKVSFDTNWNYEAVQEGSSLVFHSFRNEGWWENFKDFWKSHFGLRRRTLK